MCAGAFVCGGWAGVLSRVTRARAGKKNTENTDNMEGKVFDGDCGVTILNFISSFIHSYLSSVPGFMYSAFARIRRPVALDNDSSSITVHPAEATRNKSKVGKVNNFS